MASPGSERDASSPTQRKTPAATKQKPPRTNLKGNNSSPNTKSSPINSSPQLGSSPMGSSPLEPTQEQRDARAKRLRQIKSSARSSSAAATSSRGSPAPRGKKGRHFTDPRGAAAASLPQDDPKKMEALRDEYAKLLEEEQRNITEHTTSVAKIETEVKENKIKYEGLSIREAEDTEALNVVRGFGDDFLLEDEQYQAAAALHLGISWATDTRQFFATYNPSVNALGGKRPLKAKNTESAKAEESDVDMLEVDATISSAKEEEEEEEEEEGKTREADNMVLASTEQDSEQEVDVQGEEDTDEEVEHGNTEAAETEAVETEAAETADGKSSKETTPDSASDSEDDITKE